MLCIIISPFYNPAGPYYVMQTECKDFSAFSFTASSFAHPAWFINNIFAASFSNTIIMKITQSSLDKLSAIVHEAAYLLRYERGTFQSGWCLLEDKKIIVLNKFLDIEGRINTLLELIPQLPIEFDKLTHESQKLYEGLIKQVAAQKA